MILKDVLYCAKSVIKAWLRVWFKIWRKIREFMMIIKAHATRPAKYYNNISHVVLSISYVVKL